MANRWLVAFACAWINLFIFAVFRSAGVLYLSIISTFSCTYQQAAWPLSIVGSVASATSIFSSFLAHYIEIRVLVGCGVLICSVSLMMTYFATSIQFVTISLGLLQGIGISFVVSLLPAILHAHFEDRKAIALGISYAGATLGAFVFPVLIQWLLVEYNFHNTMLILGVISMSAIAGAWFLRKPQPPQSQKKAEEPTQQQQYTLEPLIGECDTIVYVDNNKLYDNITQKGSPDVTLSREREPPKSRLGAIVAWFGRLWSKLQHDLSLLLNVHFAICTFTYVSFVLDFVAFIIILPDVAKDKGIADVDSKWLLSIFSITDFVGRIAPGWFSYWNLVTDKSVYIVSIALMGLCMALLTTASTWLHFVLISLLCGLVTGCQMVLSPAILADYLGVQNTAMAFGWANVICGLFTLVTRPLIIGVKDIFGSYEWLSFILSGTALLSSFLWLMEILVTSIIR